MKRKNQTTKHEPEIYQDDPDAIATVSIFDPDQGTTIPVEVGYYYHDKTGSTIHLLNDPRTKQMLWEANEINLTRFSRSRPTTKKPEKNAKPAASYRPVATPSR